MINRFTLYLQEKLKEELPGKKAHQEAAPYRKIDFNSSDIKAARKSGVLVLFYQKEGDLFTVLIQRTIYKGNHSGQISFPGGKVEKTDLDIYDTALREAHEEVGVIKNDVITIGQLSDVFIPVSNFHVIPILGVSQNIPEFIIEQKEVAEVIELNVNELISTPLELNKVEINNNLLINIPTFKHQEKIIWGATALMLNELKHILKDWKA